MPSIHLKGSLVLDFNASKSAKGLGASNYAGSFVDLFCLGLQLCATFLMNQGHWPPGGGVWGRGPQEEVTAAPATAVSQELSPFDLALGASRPGTKYPVRGIPHFDKGSSQEFQHLC